MQGDLQDFVELVVVALPGVQEFIASGRTTADLWSASGIRAELARAGRDAALAALLPGERVVLPSGRLSGGHPAAGVPNRIVIAVGGGRGPVVGRGAADAVTARWRELIGESIVHRSTEAMEERAPCVWVAASGSSYAEAWERAQAALVARRRVRDFHGWYSQGGACHLCGALGHVELTPAVRKRSRDGEQLCGACATKRHFRQGTSYPSTSSLASVPYRRRVLEQLGDPSVRAAAAELVAVVGAMGHHIDLAPTRHDELPGLVGNDPAGQAFLRLDGHWVYEDSWSSASLDKMGVGLDSVRSAQLAADGASAARNLAVAVDQRPTNYLAIVVQDADRLGRRFSDNADRERHSALAAAIDAVAQDHANLFDSTEIAGRAIYAGGDDVLGFTPASTALLAAAKAQHISRNAIENATASSAVVFFHRTSPLGVAVRSAREALAEAKSSGRNRCCVVVHRRGGERARVMLHLADGPEVVESLGAVIEAMRTDVTSAGLWTAVSQLGPGLSEVGTPVTVERALGRLVRRYTTGDEVDEVLRHVLLVAGVRSTGRTADVERLTGALTVARFAAQEAS